MRRLTLTALCIACAAFALPASASATLVYVTGGGPVEPPKVPTTEYVWSANNNGGAPRRLAPGSSPSVSPNGKLVAYDSYSAGNTHLAIVPTAGGTPRILIAAHWQDQPTLAWSPDSKAIVAVTGTELGPKRLVRIDVQTGARTTLATGHDFFSAQFSPDGSRVLYTRAPTMKLTTNLFVVALATGRIRQLTSDGHSADGVWGRGWIAFARSRPSHRADEAPKQDVWLVKPAGTDLHRLTHTHAPPLLEGPAPLAWSADGARLLAEFQGQDTSYAQTVNPRTGAIRHVGGAKREYVGWGLSRSGRSILATTGGPEQFESDVVAIPWAGGKPRVLVRRAHSPSWNA